MEAFGLLGGAIREREPGTIRDHARSSRASPTRPPDRTRRTAASTLRARHLREGPDRRRGPSAGRVRHAWPPAARRHDRPDHRATRGSAPAGRCARRRDRSRRHRARLVYLQHAVVDGRTDSAGARRVVSKRFEFVEVDPDGIARDMPVGRRILTVGRLRLKSLHSCSRSSRELGYGLTSNPGRWITASSLPRAHLEEVRRRTLDRVERTTAAVRERLLSEIQHWDHRANQLKDRELAGKLPSERDELGKGSSACRRTGGATEAPPRGA